MTRATPRPATPTATRRAPSVHVGYDGRTVALSSLQAACSQIKDAAGGALAWEWDTRFGAVLTAFDSERERDVLAVLDEVFDKVWSAAELRAAPAQVSQVARSLGGLRSGQMLLTAFVDSPGPMLYCAWWPWGSGARISVRIGCAPGTGPLDPSEPDASLRRWFDVTT